MRTHDKPRMFGEFVVEGAAAGIGGLGDPVYEGAVSLGRSINGLDELRAHIRRGSNPRAAFK